MNTAGTGAKTATVIFFILVIFMIHSLYSSLFFIIALIFTNAGYAWQHQQVKTKYEKNRFHKAKIKVSEKIYRSN